MSIKKLEQYKIDYVMNGEFVKEITLTNNFIFRAFERYINRNNDKSNYVKLKNGKNINGIIKVILSADKETAFKQLMQGIKYNESEYVPLLTSPSMQKKETDECKCEYFFIKKDMKEFVTEFEKLISGNKIEKFKNENKEMCLVKDIVARVGLTTSGSYKINYNPKICIVKEATYKYFGNYTIQDENGEYKAVENYEREYTLNDGGGLMSNKMAAIIQKSLKVDYRIDFAVIRYYRALAVKGVVLRFDFPEYMKEKYLKDSEIFKKDNNEYYIKDIYGNWNNIDEIDLLLNESQAKWCNNWNSLSEIDEEYSNKEYKVYEDIINNLYVTKINKDKKDLKKYNLMNYQLLQNTAITDSDLLAKANATIKYYLTLIDFENEEIINVDNIRIFLGEIAKECKDEEIEHTITTKLNYMLLKLGKEALKIKFVKEEIIRLVSKKIKELAGGKFYMKSSYKLGVLDPLSYCNYLLTGNIGSNGLKAHEFYISGEMNKNLRSKRIISRNPIASFTEPTIIDLIYDNQEINKWLSEYTNEIIFFNGADDTLFLLSTADLDGDIFNITNNKTLGETLIKYKYPFININDGEKVKHNFTKENFYNDILSSSGNLIGKIANTNCKLCALMSNENNYVANDEVIYTFYDIQELFLKSKGIDINKYNQLEKEDKEIYKNELYEELSKKENSGELKRLKDYNNEDKRKFIAQNFLNHKELFFKILLASQLAIDTPKTLTQVPEKLLDEINNIKGYKPTFLHYLGKCECKGNGSIKNCSSVNKWSTTGNAKYENMLDKYCKRVVKILMIKCFNKKTGKGKEKLYKLLKYNYVDGNINNELVSIYVNYKKGRQDKSNIEKLNLTDYETFKRIEKLEIADDDIIATAISNKFNARFIMTFLWNTLKNKIDEQFKENNYIYTEDENGEIDFLFKRYSVIYIDVRIADIFKGDKQRVIKKIGKEIKFNGKLDRDLDLTNKIIQIKNGDIYLNNEKIGTLFKEKYEDIKDKINDDTKLIVNIFVRKLKSVQCKCEKA